MRSICPQAETPKRGNGVLIGRWWQKNRRAPADSKLPIPGLCFRHSPPTSGLVMDLKFSTFSEHRKCHDRFQSLLALGKDTRFYTQLQDEFDKYSLWADSVGATHPPSSSRSLDHRLRNASPYKQEVSTRPSGP